MKITTGRVLVACALFNLVLGCTPDRTGEAGRKPNILFVIADDQSYPHASAYGIKAFRTPAFDRIAGRGVLFTNAFVNAPQCSPSRAALLTGRPLWQLEEAGTHSSYFPKKFPVFTRRLESSGYFVGYTGKAWGPGNWKDSGWDMNPVGKEYNALKFDSVPHQGLSKIDYAGNFNAFLEEKSDDAPFFFWFGAFEPHRVYEYGSGKRASLSEGDMEWPGFLPKTDSTVNDMLDYAAEIAWSDQQLQKIMDILENSGELDNTVIIVTADNGMPFPYAKANLQESGIHVPLVICGPSIPGNRKVDDLVSFLDLAPTVLGMAGMDNMEGVVGKSLLPILESDASGIVDTTRKFVLAGRERHTHARPDNLGYPARAIRTRDFLYIRNFKPDRWPAGDPPPQVSPPDAHAPDLQVVVRGYEDIDDSPTKRVMIDGRAQWPALFKVAFEKRPDEQLYDIRSDPWCLNDLSTDPLYASVREALNETLMAELSGQEDPRVTGHGDIFDSYPRFGRMRLFDGFRRRGEYNEAYRLEE